MDDFGSFASGSTSVSLNGGRLAAFFEPTFHGIACYAKCPRESSQTAAQMTRIWEFLHGVLLYTHLLLDFHDFASYMKNTRYLCFPLEAWPLRDSIFTSTVLIANSDRYHEGLPFCFHFIISSFDGDPLPISLPEHGRTFGFIAGTYHCSGRTEG